MSNAQFYIAVFVPTLVILMGLLATYLGLFSNGKRTDAKIDGLEKKMDARFEAVSQRFDATDHRLARVETNIDQINNEIRRDHEQRITRLEERLLKAS